MSSDAPTSDARAMLEQERNDLRAKLAELGFDGGGVGLDYDSNFADSSQVTAERGEAEALASKLQETLAEVESALTKLDDGSYGTCESCGNQIAPARLEAKPAARFCIDCAAKQA